jgi:tetratricopeptide (TPR) repeat protein
MDTSMKSAFITGIIAIIVTIIGSYTLIFIESSKEHPTAEDLYPDLLSPKPRDTSITWIADARDLNNHPKYFKFQLRGPSTENKYKDKQDWSQRNSWIWNTNLDDIGNNTIRVLVTDNKNGLSDMGDDHKIYNYTISKSSLDWQNTASDLLNRSNRDEAKQAYWEAISLAPNSATLNNLGLDLYDQKIYDLALIAYDKALELNDTDPNIWKNKGDAINRQGNYDEAIMNYDEAIRLEPNYAGAWYEKGNALKSIGHDKESEAAMAKANEIEVANQKAAINAPIATTRNKRYLS